MKIRWRRWLSAWKTIRPSTERLLKAFVVAGFFGGVLLAADSANYRPHKFAASWTNCFDTFPANGDWLLVCWMHFGYGALGDSAGDSGSFAAGDRLRHLDAGAGSLKNCGYVTRFYGYIVEGRSSMWQQPHVQEQMQQLQSQRCLRGRMLNHHKNVANRNRTCHTIATDPSLSTIHALNLPVSQLFWTKHFWLLRGPPW